jgi:hypothetical protein
MLDFRGEGMGDVSGRLQRVIGAGAIALAAMGAAATGVMWRADAAAEAGAYAVAAAWRPGVPLYHRELGESLLLRSPRQALAQLQIAARLDANDPLTQAELTTVELALGEPRRAAAVAAAAQGHAPGFGAAWRLANLDLARRDWAGFWRQTGRAARWAQAGDFPPLESRALTASGYAFGALRAVLPSESAPAASALLEAALAHGDAAAAAGAAHWLLGLRPAAPADLSQRRQALLDWVTTAWQRWPAQATAAWEAVRAGGLLPFAAKRPRAPYLDDGDFNPLRQEQAERVAPDPASALRAIVGWGWPGATGVRCYQVLTADAAHPSAAELAFDGDESDGVMLAQQWLLARPGATLTVTAWRRALAGAHGDGLSLQLTTPRGAVLGDLPLPLTGAWERAQAQFALPPAAAGSGGVATYQLELHYRRPNGALPLHLDALVSGITVR